MALSNSFDYTHTVTAAQIIALALRRLGVYDPAETIDSTEEANALQVLNLILKEWGNEGADIWLRDTMYLMLNTTTSATSIAHNWYTISASSNAYLMFGFNAVSKIDGAVSAGNTSIVVEDATGMVTTNIIFVKQSDNTMFATTINGAPVGNTITLAAALTQDVDDGAVVYTSTASTNRFTGTILQIQSANLVSPTDSMFEAPALDSGQAGLLYETTPIEIVGSDELHSFSRRNTTGRPQAIYHVRKPTASEFHIWPNGFVEDVDAIELVAVYPIMDLDSTSDNLYITPDAFNALGWGLAAEMASEYGLSEQEQKRLWQISEMKKQNVFDFNVEDASVIFSRDE